MMRNRYETQCCVHILSLFAVLSAYGSELLTNPGFESGTTGWTRRSCSYAAETNEVHTGSGAVRVYNRNSVNDRIEQDFLSSVSNHVSGSKYTARAWFRMDSGSHTVNLKLRTKLQDGSTKVEYIFTGTADDTGWTEIVWTTNMLWSGGPLSEALFQLYCDTSDATFYVDDCSLERTGVNNAPSFGSDPVVKAPASAGVPYNGTLSGEASDPDSDPLRYSKLGGSSWLAIARDGTFSGIPPISDLGTNIFTVWVADPFSASDTADLEIVVNEVPLPPSFHSDPVVELNAVAGVPYDSTLSDDASDINGDPISFSKLDGPAWLTVAADGSLSGTPATGDSGVNEFNVRVEGGGSNDTATLQISVVEGSVLSYADSFETNSLWSTIRPVRGWSSSESDSPQIRRVDYDYSGGWPITGLRHEQILDVNGPVESCFSSTMTHTSVVVDAMIQPALRTDPAPPSVNPASQAAFFFNGNGSMEVYHGLYTNNFTRITRQWSELEHTAITNGQWIRLKVLSDYLSDGLRNDKYYSIELDGELLTNAAAYNTYSPTNEVADMGGSLFLCPNSGNGAGSGVVASMMFDGLARVDDLTVSSPASVTVQGTPFEWIEYFYPGSDPQATDLLDTDGDGLTTWQEYLAGTDPTRDDSTLSSALAVLPGGEFEINWPSSFGGPLTPYSIYSSTNLLAPGGGWELREADILRDPSGINSWQDPAPPESPSVFYRPAVQDPE